MMNAGKRRVDFYQYVCPEYADQAKDAYIEICLHLVLRSHMSPDCDLLRQQATEEVWRVEKEIRQCTLRKKTVIKMLLLKLGIPMYTLSMNNYYALSTLLRRLYRIGGRIIK